MSYPVTSLTKEWKCILLEFKVDTIGQTRREHMRKQTTKGKENRQKGADRAKINNSQDAVGQKQMAPRLRGLSGPWQKPVTHIT